MTISLPVLIGILVVIVGLALLQIISRSRKSHRRKRQSIGAGPLKKGRRILARPDHGARIAKMHGHDRSPQWSRVAHEHLLREPACVACGHKTSLQVHHIKPFHLHPQLELDPTNLITLCEGRGRDHHLLLGHLDEWKSYNDHVRPDAKHFYKKSAAQIRADILWLKKMAKRP